MSHEEAEPHNMGFYLFIRGDFGHPCPIFLSGKIGQGCPKSLYTPDFCIALLGDRPEILSGRPLSNYNKAMSHEEAEPHNMGFYLFIRGLWTPLPYFPLRKIGQGCPKSLYTPDFCIALLGDRPEILSGRPLSNYNKAMSHEREQNRTTWVSTSSFGRLWTPLPIFLSGKIGQGVQIPQKPC